MKKYIVVFLVFMICAPVAGREVYNMNSDWKFFNGRATSSDGAQTVTLPHTWNSDATAGNDFYYRGVGNYLKDIDVPGAWAGRRVFIKGYGANSVATVFVNGKLAGEHRGGYTAWCFEITDLLRPGGRNYFRIVVNNAAQLDVLPTAGDMNVYGGLFRDVELIVTGRDVISLTDHASQGVYIKQKKVTPQRAEAEAVVKVSGRNNAAFQALVTVATADGATVATADGRVKLNGTEGTVTIPFVIDSPRLWNGREDPYLYTVDVKLKSGDAVADEVTFETGFRFFAVSPTQGFTLNGEPYRLHGVVVHQDRPITANALNTGQLEEDVRLIAGMGANAVRVQGVAHHPDFYRMCDREGIIVWSDFPLMGEAYLTDKAFINTGAFRANGIEQATDIMRQQFNHPCVVMWGVFSDMHTRDDDPTAYIKQLNELAKKEDPSRLTAAASNQDGDINFITDLVCWNHHFGWKEGMPGDINIWKRQFLARWGNLRSAVSYGAGASIYHQDAALSRPAYQGNRHPERWQTHLHETYYNSLRSDAMFWGIFIGNMFDYGAVGRDWGENKGINDLGLVTYDRKDCKDAYYFYKANWNDSEPFVYIAERRRNKRASATQEIKLYSNLGEAELFVNGMSQGRRTARNGTVIWQGVRLKEGVNVIEARAGDQKDYVRIEVRTGTAGQRSL